MFFWGILSYWHFWTFSFSFASLLSKKGGFYAIMKNSKQPRPHMSIFSVYSTPYLASGALHMSVPVFVLMVTRLFPSKGLGLSSGEGGNWSSLGLSESLVKFLNFLEALKSINLIALVFALIIMLSGFRSLWHTPFLWQYSIACVNYFMTFLIVSSLIKPEDFDCFLIEFERSEILSGLLFSGLPRLFCLLAYLKT